MSPIKILLLFSCLSFPLFGKVQLSDKDALLLGKKIWENECRGTEEGLTSWNQGEDFASMGIGHFIWYPSKRDKTYGETFPQLLSFLKEHKASLPKWLSKAPPCPWKSRKEFQKAQNSQKMKELRKLLKDTFPLQALFIANRLQEALPRILAKSTKEEGKKISEEFHRLSKTPEGLYALTDYLNFKGEGLSQKEQAAGKGWGLKQVLLTMADNYPKEEILFEFVRAAKKLLLHRVLSTPQRAQERRWLLGWRNRLESYLIHSNQSN